MNLNIKVRGENKKEISKILIGLIVLNIIVSIITIIFVNNEILKTIILYLISIIYIGITIYIIKKVNEKPILTKKEKFENKYDPILTRFFIKNEFELDDTLLNAEIYYLIKKGYVTIDKNNNILKLNNREQFKPIPPLEQINNNKIAECSTEEIPSYESMFINKILFAFHDEIQINEFNKNIKENYYHQRGELCKLAMEKMILFEIEKNNMLKQTNNINFISIISILNIVTAIIVLLVMARFNILLLLAVFINIALNVIIIKNENILSYKYSEEIIKYIDDLLEYVKILKIRNKDSKEKNLNKSNLEIIIEKLEMNIKEEGIKEEKENNEEVIEEESEKNNDDKQLELLFNI